MPSRRTKISLQPGVLQWARERARVSRDELARKMQVNVDRVVEWEETGNISVAQADRLAERTHTPWVSCTFQSRPKTNCQYQTSGRAIHKQHRYIPVST